MIADILFLIASLALIIKGGDLFMSAAVRIAGMLRMPLVVIGGTLVSLATTSPETVVSVMDGLNCESGLAMATPSARASATSHSWWASRRLSIPWTFIHDHSDSRCSACSFSAGCCC